MRDNPISVDSSGKADVLRYIGEMCSEDSGKGKYMKKRSIKRIVIIAAAVLSLTMMVSAALVSYIYRTPDGQFVDESGTQTEKTDRVQSAENLNDIMGEGFAITSVTWTQANGRTTLAVWTAPDAEELTGLKAVIDGKEYPLEKKAFNLSGGYIGYTTTNIDEPTEFLLVCGSPAFEAVVSFVPEEVVPENYSNGMTLFGTVEEGKVFIGVNDENYLTSGLFRNARVSFVAIHDETVTDNMGNEYTDIGKRLSYKKEMIDKGMLLQLNASRKVPAENTVVSVHTPCLEVIYDFRQAARDGLAPSVNIPLPADGETITGEWVLLGSDGFSYVINSISRNGNSLEFVSDHGLTYDGIYSVASDRTTLPRNHIITNIKGEGGFYSKGMINNNEMWTSEVMEGNVLEDYIDENGEFILELKELNIVYEGDWTLNFAE